MDKHLTKLSKFLALVLRHKPDTIGIILCSDGWTNIDTLIENANSHGVSITRENIENIVKDNDKKRYSISEDGKMIRAEQGHSVKTVDMGYEPVQPPEFLYHGTSTENKDIILKNGIDKMSRQYVHLSDDIETAQCVAKRHSKNTCILMIESGKMFGDGFVFHNSKNNVWLTNNVPSEYVKIHDFR